MKKKLFPPPPEIVQRARCYLALRVLRAYVEVMGQTSDRRFDELMGTIRRWLVECEALLERRPVSNRTDSEVIAKLEVVLSRIDCGPHKPSREQYTHWGAAIFCAHILLVDVRATCPAWYGKPVRRKNAAGAITSRYPWRYLCGAVQRLAEGLEATIPETGELGTKIYMQIAE
jgi:hypothetical protein